MTQAAPELRRLYHFHLPGVIYLGVTIFVAVGAINSQNNLLFGALGLAIGALLVSGFFSGSSLMGLQPRRLPPPRAQVGRPFTLSYRLENRARLVPAFALHLEERPTVPWASPPEARGFCAVVQARGATTAEITLTPARRGVHRLADLRVWSTFPFGLTKKSVTNLAPASVVVLPAAPPLKRSAVARLAAAADLQGVERSVPGSGEDFYGVREYAPGDSPRRVAWRATARLGHVLVRQNAAPTPRRCHVELRAPAHGDPVRLERAVALAAALLAHAQRQGVAFGLIAGPISRPTEQGRGHLEQVLTDLATFTPGQPAAGPPKPTILVVPGPDRPSHTGPVLTADDLETLLEDSPEARATLALIDAGARA